MHEDTLYMQDFSIIADLLPELRPARPSDPAPAGSTTLLATDLASTYPSSAQPSLVTENGSAKSILAKLLPGLHFPDAGTICREDMDIRGCDPDKRNKSVALILQDSGHYCMKAGEHICFSYVDRIDECGAIDEVSRLAQADRSIEALPLGYDNLLGRCTSARPSCTSANGNGSPRLGPSSTTPCLVVLDEPTAGLDSPAEAAPFENVPTLCSGRAAAQLPPLIECPLAGHISMMESGLAVEQGTCEEPGNEGGLCADLFELQASANDPGRRHE